MSNQKQQEESHHLDLDNEVLAYLSVRKDELIKSHSEYIDAHAEIREVMNDFISSVLLHKPDNVFVYAKEYFHPFNPTPMQSKPLIVVGPSGVGKRVLIQAVVDKYGDLFQKKRSYTTRKPRENEDVNKAPFNFVSVAEFNKMIEEKKFIEKQEKLQGALYGTAYSEVERIKNNGMIPILEVDVQGALDINNQAIEGNFLFIYPPNIEELRRRIGNRIETEMEFKVRIADAIKQIELANNSVLFTHRIVNDKLDLAKDQFFTLLEALYFQEIRTMRAKMTEGTQAQEPEQQQPAQE